MSGAKHVISAVGKPDYVEEQDQMDILMPFLNHGDLQQMIVKCIGTQGCVCHKPQSGICFEAMGKPWSKALILVYFYHAAQGVQEMHQKGLVHMDIKTPNIMLNCASADPTSYLASRFRTLGRVVDIPMIFCVVIAAKVLSIPH